MDDYVNKMEKIVARNLEIYTDMQAQLGRFKLLLKDEEEAHKKIGRETFHYYWSCLRSFNKCFNNYKLLDDKKSTFLANQMYTDMLNILFINLTETKYN